MEISIVDSSAVASATTALLSLGKASDFVKKNDNSVAVACEASKEILIRRVQFMIASSVGQPLLSSKSCDGTPVRAQFSANKALPTGKRVPTRGKMGKELLVANQFVRYNHPAEGWQTSCLLAEPVPLSEGKAASAILSAARRTWKSLRSLGAKGGVLEHYCWGRAGITALERLVREWHHTQPVPVSDEFGPEVLKLLELVVVTPCALHDSQNAFRWGLLSQCQDRQLMRDVYISVEALRNSADLLHSRIGSWIALTVDFREARGMDWVCRQRELWTALGVDADFVELLSAELELSFEGDTLWVKRGAQVTYTPDCFCWGAVVL